MLTIEKLKEYGADTETGLSRCAGNEALYLRLVGICIQELSSDALAQALEAGELEKAFDIVHKLKGGVTNLALTPVAEPVCELTELLRSKTPADFNGLYEVIREETKKLTALSE